MQVPMTIRDHLERARFVYGDRIGIHDEPDQPASGDEGRDDKDDATPVPSVWVT